MDSVALHWVEEGTSPGVAVCSASVDSFRASWLLARRALAVGSHNHVAVACSGSQVA